MVCATLHAERRQLHGSHGRYSQQHSALLETEDNYLPLQMHLHPPPAERLTCANLGRRPQEHQLRGWHRGLRWPQSSLGRKAGPAGSVQHEGAVQGGCERE